MTGLLQLVEVPAGPELLVMDLDASAATTAVWNWIEAGLTARVVRGPKMRTTSALLNEVSAALQFPHYFGENWAALDECLADMDWLNAQRGIVVTVLDAQVVLEDEPVEELAILVKAFAHADAWAAASPSRRLRGLNAGVPWVAASRRRGPG